MSWPWKRQCHSTEWDTAVGRLVASLLPIIRSTAEAIESTRVAAGQRSTRRSRAAVALETWWFYLCIVDWESFQFAGKEIQGRLFDKLVPLIAALLPQLHAVSEVLVDSAPQADIGSSAAIGERFWKRYDQVAMDYASRPRALLGDFGDSVRGDSMIGHLGTRIAALGEQQDRLMPLAMLECVGPADIASVIDSVRAACEELRQE